jgi:hypothetical protein
MVVVEGFGDKINMWVGLVFIAAGIFQLWLGYQGIEYHLGAGWAIAAAIAAFGFRFMLPLTIGSYFGAVDVMGWDWYIGVAIAAPGVVFLLPFLGSAMFDFFRNAIEFKGHKLNQIQGAENPSTLTQSFSNVIRWLTSLKFIVGAVGINAAIDFLFFGKNFEITDIFSYYLFKIDRVLNLSLSTPDLATLINLIELIIIAIGIYLTIEAAMNSNSSKASKQNEIPTSKKSNPRNPKQRMWGTFLVAFIMLFLGIIVSAESGRHGYGLASLAWIVILWSAATGNVQSVKQASVWGMALQLIGGVLFVFLSTNPDTDIIYAIFGLSGLSGAIFSIGSPVLIWALVYWNANSLNQRIALTEENWAETTPASSVGYYPQQQKKPSTLEASNNALRPAQNQSIIEAEVIENNSKISPKANVSSKLVDTRLDNNLTEYPNARTAIEYDDRAKNAWLELHETPDNLKKEFMGSLEKDPKQNVTELKDRILIQYDKVINPFDTDEVNIAYGKARLISNECAAEFRRVFEILGDTLPIEDLLDKVKIKVQKAKVSPEKLESLRNAILEKYHFEIIDCLIDMNYSVEETTDSQEFGQEFGAAVAYKIFCPKGFPALLRKSELLRYANEELIKLENA